MRSTIKRTGVLGMMAVLLLLLAVSAAGLSPHTALAAAPANDNFGSATSASPLPFSDTQSTTDATKEGGEPAPTCQASFGLGGVSPTTPDATCPAVGSPF